MISVSEETIIDFASRQGVEWEAESIEGLPISASFVPGTMSPERARAELRGLFGESWVLGRFNVRAQVGPHKYRPRFDAEMGRVWEVLPNW